MSDADQETPKGPEVSVPPLKLKPLTEAAQKKEEEREARKSRKPTSQNIQDIVKSQLEPMFEMIKGLKEDQGQFFWVNAEEADLATEQGCNHGPGQHGI